MFLQSIEEPGGFRDACIANQKSSVEELEREVGILYERCRTWKVMFPTYFLVIVFFRSSFIRSVCVCYFFFS